MAMLCTLLLAAAAFDSFDEALDPQRWYVGVPDPPANGRLRIPRDGWIVARGLPEDRERIEIVFRHRGGTLEVAFFDEKEPLSSPQGAPLLVPPAEGDHELVLTAAGAELDGKAVPSPGWRGTFRLRAHKGDVEIDEVRVAPRPPAPPAAAAGVFAATTPPTYRDAARSFSRVTVTIWDAEVTLLLVRGAPAIEELRAPPKGSPVLAALVTAGDGVELARANRRNALAQMDWRDEARNLTPGGLDAYLAEEYAIFALLRDAQRALNLAAGSRKGLEPLAHLAVIRHATNAHAAVGFAETEGARDALAALKKALKGEEPARATGERLREAAAEAARAILKEPPPEWSGFRFEASGRYAAIERLKELVR